MSNKKFLQKGFDKQLSHLIEECGEVLAAAGKTQRFGIDSVNPLSPVEQQESNLDRLIRELRDLKDVICRLEVTIIKEHK